MNLHPRSRLPALLVLVAAATSPAATMVALAVAADGELARWLQMLGWWAYPLLGLTLVQTLASALLGLGGLNRPVATWAWLALPAIAVLLGALGTRRGLDLGASAIAAATLAQRVPLWAAVRAEASQPLVLGLVVAAQGCVGMLVAAGLAAWRNAPPRSWHHWPHAVAVASLGAVLPLAMATLITGNHGDADMARWAWLAPWTLGLGLALVPAALGSSALTASDDFDERAVGLRLATQAGLGAVGGLGLHAMAQWHAHVAGTFASVGARRSVDASSLLEAALESLQRTLRSTSSAAVASLLLALALLLPLVRRAPPRLHELRRALPAALMLAGLAAVQLSLAAWSTSLGSTVLDAVTRRSPSGVALPSSDAGAELSIDWPLWTWSTTGWRVDGDAATLLPLPGRTSTRSDQAGCTRVNLAAPATLPVVELRALRAHLLRTGVCELGLAVARLDRPGQPSTPAPSPGFPPTLWQELQRLNALRFERWGELVLRLDTPRPADVDSTTALGHSRAKLGSQALVLVDTDGLRTQVVLPPAAALDARTLQAHWSAARDRGALSGALQLSASDDVTLAALVEVLASTRVREASDGGRDPFGYDPGAREHSLFEAVHWIP